jgi:hypothetical protein
MHGTVIEWLPVSCHAIGGTGSSGASRIDESCGAPSAVAALAVVEEPGADAGNTGDALTDIGDRH